MNHTILVGAATVVVASLALAGCGSASAPLAANAPATVGASITGSRVSGVRAFAPSPLRKLAASKAVGEKGLYAVPTGGGTEAVPQLANLYPASDRRNAGPGCYVGGDNPSYLIGGIAVDRIGHLWIPQGSEVGSIVQEFGTRCTADGRPATILRTLNDPDGQADGIAIDSKQDAFVNNIITGATSGFGPGNVAVYSRNATTPSALLDPSGAGDVFGIAVDSADNLYVSVSAPLIEEFPHGSNPGTVLSLSGLNYPIGLCFDAKQNMLVVDTALNSVLIYAPPYSGGPTSTITLHVRGGFGAYGFAALNAGNTRLYVNNTIAGTVEVYSYPNGKYLYSISKGLYPANGDLQEGVTGIALDPASPN